MPVMINDFDVTVEPPRQDEQRVQAAPAPAERPTPRPLSPEAVQQMVQQMYERRRRVWAD